MILGISFTHTVSHSGIMLSNFGQEWESAHLHTKTVYRAGTKTEIMADVGVKIGLRSVNITLKSQYIAEPRNSVCLRILFGFSPHEATTFMHNNLNVVITQFLDIFSIFSSAKNVQEEIDTNVIETIDYNERFTWAGDGWHLGRIGFGPFGKHQKDELTYLINTLFY